MRIALGVSYNGQAYSGWQSQLSGNTVQDHLEAALGRFTAQKVSTLCAGRTDAGVHGLMQVVHFDTALQRAANSWVRGTNAFLPKDIAVQWAAEVPDGPEGFHSRACATARRYAYVLLQSPVRPSVDHGRVGWVYQPLDGERMRAAADLLLGEHDFSSFRAAACQAKTPIKTLHRIDMHYRPAGQAPMREGEMDCGYWRFEFEGNAFLHHMIRNIMGCLLCVGQGAKPVEWMQQVLDARSREVAAPTFSPDGLYFLGPVYDARWGLPGDTPPFAWLP
ncbi:tRNA pseudouridine(38-40) synthase TruA [Comamonas sp. GB3 AK4-5]|uniref:tRNA pseudouridine(38-40) synthase TruA n=1 Tax=Comamonas sp. GB3 AK4-5 TaxID=3231487 RepID=UPI00351F3387